jgi:hypothetical protein
MTLKVPFHTSLGPLTHVEVSFPQSNPRESVRFLIISTFSIDDASTHRKQEVFKLIPLLSQNSSFHCLLLASFFMICIFIHRKRQTEFEKLCSAWIWGDHTKIE